MLMQTLVHADIFFFIASIGFIVVTCLVAVGLVYMIVILRNVRSITEKVEAGIDTAEEEVKEFVSDLRESRVFQMLFGGRKHKKSETKK
ncbi:MAG: hypothetical protein WCG84_01140 [Candidatus Moraniibacteriota bacterium]